MSKILIIDDEDGVRRLLSIMVTRNGHEAVCAPSLGEGMAVVRDQPIDLVFLDVHLPDGDGLKEISHIHEAPTRPEIIVLTGQGDPDGAELAMMTGVWDYIQKPADLKAIGLPLIRALEYRKKKMARPGPVPIRRDGIIGSGKALAQAFDQLAQSAASDAGVLITGETGTGKELFAHAVHRNSPRAEKNFVVLDCAALPDTLVESVLFGHLKGAFTGADAPRDGLVKQADGGTLFLDEVGEMPLGVQKAFLRVLETHRFRPIGGKEEIHSNFRIVSSTNRDLNEMVRQGRFRKDLLFRLRSFHLALPPLRKRQEDIRELAVYHVNRLCALYNEPAKSFSPDFFDTLAAYDWPGNVRELVNTMERAIASARHDSILFACDLPKELRAQVARNSVRPQSRTSWLSIHMDLPEDTRKGGFPSLQCMRDRAVVEMENSYLSALMSAVNGSIPSACSLSGVSRSRLYELLKKHAIPVG